MLYPHVFFVVLTVLLLLSALALRLCGARPLVNTIDYRTIRDAKQFNRYVGLRMLFPAAVAASFAWATYLKPTLGIPLIFAFPLSVWAVVIWVGVGSKRFAVAPVRSA